MHQMWSILTMIYEFGIFPILLGLLWLGKAERAGFSRIYARGYFCMLALFEVLAVPMLRTGRSLTELADAFRMVSFAAIPAVLIVLFIRRKLLPEKCRELWENGKTAKAKVYGTMIFCLVAALFSVVFVLPSEADDTAETVAIAIDTDTMYGYETYTKNPLAAVPEEKAASPIEMLYAAGAVNSGVDSARMLHLYLPFFLLPFFFCVSWQAGRYLFGSRLEQCGLFVILIVVFYSAACYTVTTPVMGALQNIWNGTSLLICCGIPAVTVQGFCLLGMAEQKKVSVRELFYTVIILLGNQLMLTKGAMLSVLVLLGCVGIFVIRKGIKHVIST